ncbi:unnamed protein product [Closterium sp. NIES-53]
MPIRPLPHSPLAISTPHGFKPPVLSFPACSITTTWRCILHVHPPPRTTPHHTTPQQHRKKLILILRALAPFTYCSFCPIHVPPAAAAAAAPVAPAAGMACRGFLQCLLKLFNFALAIVGVLLIVYSLSRLIHLDPDLHPPNPPSPSPSPSPSSLSSSSRLAPVPMHLSSPLPDATQLVSGSSSSSSSSASSLGGRRQLGASSNELRLPNLWFIYVLVGGGALLTLVTIVGAVAAESNNGCCLSCYQFGLCVLLLIQGSLAALVWLQDVPEDPTGEYERERAFVLRNLDLCRLAAVSLLLVEGAALLLAMMLRAMHSDAALADDDDDYIPPHPHPNSRLRQPLLRPPHMAPPPPYSAAIPSSSADAAAAGGGSGVSGVGVGGAADGAAAAAAAAGGEGGAAALSDAWRNRILEKYGLDTNEFHHPVNTPHAPPMPPQPPPSSSACALM